MTDYLGRCPCGRVELTLRSALSPAELTPRTDARTCTFCQEHDGVWISDPAGVLVVRARESPRVHRFASGEVAFHFCGVCGTLTHATFDDATRTFAVARVALFGALHAASRPPVETDFTGETPADGRARRVVKWTPLQARAEGRDGGPSTADSSGSEAAGADGSMASSAKTYS